MLVQEPANTMKWVDDRGLVVHVEPGFDFSRDFCAKDLAYVTVLRPPVSEFIRTCARLEPRLGCGRTRLTVDPAM